MIHDGVESFPDSCVQYVKFRYFFLRERFAKLREQELCLQKTLSNLDSEYQEKFKKVWREILRSEFYTAIRAKLFLEFTESELLWMAHNVSEDCVINSIQERRDRKAAKEERQKKQLEINFIETDE